MEKNFLKKQEKCYYTKFAIILFLLMSSFAQADFDGDGKADVFVIHEVAGETAVEWWEGVENFNKQLAYTGISFGADSNSIWTGNLDNDSYQDILVGFGKKTEGIDRSSTWYEATGIDNAYRLVNQDFSTNVTAWAVGNFNDNAYSDVFYIQCNELGNTWIGWYEATANDQLTYVGPISTGNSYSLAVGDIDHFLGKDLLIAKDTAISWYESSGGSGYYWVENFNGVKAVKILIGNFDDDEWPDVIFIDALRNNQLIWWETHSSGDGATFWVEVNDRNGAQLANNNNFTDISLGDVDGDGITELMATKSDNSVRWIAAASSYSTPDLTVVNGIWKYMDGTEFGNPGVAIAVEGINGPSDVGEFLPCDGKGKLEADINADCSVNIQDIKILAEQWLQ